MEDIIKKLHERNFIELTTDYDNLTKQLKNPTVCYTGFDPTAKSLHIGNLLPIMCLIHLQRCGHKPVIVIGGGTALIGDPSGKTKARRLMSHAEINDNTECLKTQISRFIDLKDNKALIVNNADWLTGLGYIDFLRDIGKHFSVNKMLTAESYKTRLETGLSFIEFNYMLLQSYDFWYLFKHYDCKLQIGGSDQWGNIVAGIDLIRRTTQESAYGLTLPLLTTSSGFKMGKTHNGAIWLDPELTSPYDYYQYWINQDDKDVENFLKLFTFLPIDEIKYLGSLKGSDIRKAKSTLAYEATKLCHGEDAANGAYKESIKFFSPTKTEIKDFCEEDMSSIFKMNKKDLTIGIPAFVVFEIVGLCSTKSEARRLISQGGGYLNGSRVENFDTVIDMTAVVNNIILLRAGKKKHIQILVED